MSFIDFDYDNNSVRICKGHSKNREKLLTETGSEQFNILKHKNTFKGVEVFDYFLEHELDGMKGEEKFKKLLDNNNVACLYIGQGSFGIEKSEILLKKIKSKRPDFLVATESTGEILVDVKCRSKISFHNTVEKFFTIPRSELESLMNLQETFSMKVWLAYLDRSTVMDEKPIFYLISISRLKNFFSQLEYSYPETHSLNDVSMLRIPNELFIIANQTINFGLGNFTFDNELIKNFIVRNTDLSDHIKKKIKEAVRIKECLKTKLYEELKNMGIDYAHPIEVYHHLDKLINAKRH